MTLTDSSVRRTVAKGSCVGTPVVAHDFRSVPAQHLRAFLTVVISAALEG
jgi:hypothetical protein